MNTCIIIGRLTRDPMAGTTRGTSNYTKFSVAVDRDYKNAEGDRPVDFFDVICWGKLAEVCANNLTKGRLVCLSCSMYSSSYNDDQDKTHRSWSIRANTVDFLDSKKSAGTEESPAPPPSDNDVPF